MKRINWLKLSVSETEQTPTNKTRLEKLTLAFGSSEFFTGHIVYDTVMH